MFRFSELYKPNFHSCRSCIVPREMTRRSQWYLTILTSCLQRWNSHPYNFWFKKNYVSVLSNAPCNSFWEKKMRKAAGGWVIQKKERREKKIRGKRRRREKKGSDRKKKMKGGKNRKGKRKGQYRAVKDKKENRRQENIEGKERSLEGWSAQLEDEGRKEVRGYGKERERNAKATF